MSMQLSRKTIPYTPVSKPLSEMTIMIVSTAGTHLKSQEPYNTSGDATYRIIPGDVQTADLTVTHGAPIHDYNWEEPRRDPNTIFPIDRLREIAAQGIIGGVADKHISMMGYALRLNEINAVTAPEIAKEVDHSRADAVLLTAG
ncbi:MAG: glycine/sarcosine/betaine reductase selenoprotein B family protein [Firmicutes bacterium]|nr:glycine/sarcosine/betaine reductase selenoprotein B family protein [Bacillota bacterium]